MLQHGGLEVARSRNKYLTMSEFNDGMRPNFELDFDAAMKSLENDEPLQPHHEAAISRVQQLLIPTLLTSGREYEIGLENK